MKSTLHLIQMSEIPDDENGAYDFGLGDSKAIREPEAKLSNV